MKLLWIDPPEGWRYGFPKQWDQEKHPDLIQWLRDNGLPESLIELGHVRSWYSDDVQNDQS